MGYERGTNEKQELIEVLPSRLSGRLHQLCFNFPSWIIFAFPVHLLRPSMSDSLVAQISSLTCGLSRVFNPPPAASRVSLIRRKQKTQLV